MTFWGWFWIAYLIGSGIAFGIAVFALGMLAYYYWWGGDLVHIGISVIGILQCITFLLVCTAFSWVTVGIQIARFDRNFALKNKFTIIMP